MTWWWIIFVVWLTDESRFALFPGKIIVRDPHHRESLTPQAGFEPAKNLSSGLVEWSCAVVINMAPRLSIFKNGKKESGSFRDTHREKEPSNKTTALTKSKNMGIWVVGTSKSTLYKSS